MHIAIDARLNAYRQGGIPQYTRQLLTALAEVARDDQIISLQHRDQLRPLAVAPNVVRRTILTPPHHRFEQWALPLELLRIRRDVLHCPDFIAPVRRPCPAVVTIHDLAFMHYPEILDDAARAYYGQIKSNAARVDGIIAVSEATRQDVAQFLDIPIEEIAVIHEAAAPLYGRLELREGEARVLNATPVAAGTFMLFVSTLEPRKNLPTLLQALRICLDRRPDRRYLLVVAGGRGWRDEVIFETVRELRLGDHVLFAGSVGQYDLRWLYNACRFYINPSLYEGFGLPLLEAMACGAACLAAATSSLPEIGGEAAIYIPPLDAGLWADAIAELWDDEERQRELGRLGRIQSQHFSWVRAARETLKVYERAIERARRGPAAAALPAPAPNRPLATGEQIGDEAALPALPGSAAAEAIPSLSDAVRACLRCGTAMQAGQLQRTIAFQPVENAPDQHVLAPQVWACPRCGHVELVVEQVQHAQAQLGAAVEPSETRAPEEWVEDRQDSIAAAPDSMAIDGRPTEAADAVDAIGTGLSEADEPGGANNHADMMDHASLDDTALERDQPTSSNGSPTQDELAADPAAPVQPADDSASGIEMIALNGMPEANPAAPDAPLLETQADAEPPDSAAAATDDTAVAQTPRRRQSRSKRKRS